MNSSLWRSGRDLGTHTLTCEKCHSLSPAQETWPALTHSTVHSCPIAGLPYYWSATVLVCCWFCVYVYSVYVCACVCFSLHTNTQLVSCDIAFQSPFVVLASWSFNLRKVHFLHEKLLIYSTYCNYYMDCL